MIRASNAASCPSILRVFAGSYRSDGMTGQALNVDGGWVMY
jgi:hypothetical protein